MMKLKENPRVQQSLESIDGFTVHLSVIFKDFRI